MAVSPDSVPVLLTNPCGQTGEIVARSLSEKGVRVSIMERPNAKKREAFFIQSLKEKVREERPGMIIPVFFPEILSVHKDEFPGVNIPLDTSEKILRLDNKLSACGLASSLGLPQPKRYFSVAEVESFPCVFKRTTGQGGDSVYFPAKPSALECLVRNAKDPSGYLIMEFVEGSNVCVDALRWDDFFYAAAYKVLEPSGKGVSRLRESIEAPELVSYVRRMLDAVDYRGVCGVDFRVDKEGRAFFLECNPRFSGGIASAIASGFDVPYLYYCLALGIPVRSETIVFKPGIRTI
ncbi:MAG: ATP-grasp domain-containing protein [Bacteroidales bacterium]|nr:ATP-grasp domain-containing protein [Bacteroidales bacterium]